MGYGPGGPEDVTVDASEAMAVLDAARAAVFEAPERTDEAILNWANQLSW